MDRANSLADVRCSCGTGKDFGSCCQTEDVDLDALKADTLAALHAANASPEFVYAYERTGLIVFAQYRDRFSAADLDEWDDAVAEWRENHPAGN